MAQTARNIPANYPPALGAKILKADAHRQVSILRQELVTELLSVLADAREPAVRSRLIKLVEANLRSGIAAARRAEDLWPSLDDAKHAIDGRTEMKPALVKKHWKLFEQYDRVQRRSLVLLEDSFQSVRVILDRIQPLEQPPANSTAGTGKR